MIEKKFKEVGRYDNHIIYGSGNWRRVCDSDGKVITEFNLAYENFKTQLKKGVAISVGLAMLFAPLYTLARSHNTPKKATSLEQKFNVVKPGKEISLNSLRKYESNANKDKLVGGIYKEREDYFSSNNEIPSYINNAFVKATIEVECSWNPNEISTAGAKGYPQTYFSTWKEVFPNNSYHDFEEGIKDKNKSSEFIIKYYANLDKFLKENFSSYKDLCETEKRSYLAAAYNCGPYKLQKANWNLASVPNETRNHIAKIRREYAKYE
jgi:hypothetical protein